MRFLIAAAMISFLFGLPIAGLMQSANSDRARSLNDPDGMVDVRDPRLPQAVVFPAASAVSGGVALRLPMTAPQSPALCRGSSIELHFGTYFKTVPIQSVDLASDDGTCRFSSGPFNLSDNATARLIRHTNSESASATSMTLTITTQEPTQLALWGVAGEWSGALLRAQQSDGSTVAIIGTLFAPETARATFRKADLLAYAWQIPAAAVWTMLVAGALSVLVGVLIWPSVLTHAMKPKVGNQALAAAAILFGLGLSYAVLTPPFHAPDEPDHFLSIVRDAERSQLEAEALRLAQIGHFERIKFRAAEELTAADIGTPLAGGWSLEIGAPSAKTRSSFFRVLVRPWHYLLHDLEAGESLLAMRIANVVLMTLCVLIGVRAILPLADRQAMFALAPILTVPTLPFFAMHVSNYAWTTGFACLTALCFGGVLRHPSRLLPAIVGGAALCGLFNSSTSAIAALPGFVAGFVTASWFLEPAATPPQPKFRARTGLAFLAMLLPGALIADSTFVHAVVSRFDLQTKFNLGQLPLIAVFACASLAGAILHVGGVKVVSAVQRSGFGRWLIATAAPIVVVVAMLFLVGRAMLSEIAPLPDHTTQIALGFRPIDYAILALKKFAAALSFGHHEFFLSHSFWFGFGWLETSLPPVASMILRSVPTVAIIAGFATLACQPREAAFAPSGRGLFALAAALGIFVTTAYGAGAIPDVLHGRYLICFYLIFLTAAYWLGEVAVNGSRLAMKAKTGVALAVCVAVPIAAHASSLALLVHRYF